MPHAELVVRSQNEILNLKWNPKLTEMSKFIQTSFKAIWIFNNGDTWSLGCKNIKMKAKLKKSTKFSQKLDGNHEP